MRGQSSVEYLMTMSLLLLIILPAVTMFMQYAQDQKVQVEEAQLFSLGSKLALSTQEVYYQGEGSRLTITTYFPERLENITFIPYTDRPGGEYVVYYRGITGTVSDIGFPVSVSVFLNTSSAKWGAGTRSIQLDGLRNTTSGELYVNVTVK